MLVKVNKQQRHYDVVVLTKKIEHEEKTKAVTINANKWLEINESFPYKNKMENKNLQEWLFPWKLGTVQTVK